MCGLFAARTKVELVELAQHNIHRGSRTHSITTFKRGDISIQRYKGSFNAKNVPDDADFYICHVQAPTSANAKAHPASAIRKVDNVEFSSSVWHNGILKEPYMAKQRFDWDTMHIADTFPESLDEYDGSFACFQFQRQDLCVFRNEISPLFFGETGAFSSTKTLLTPTSLEPNKVFSIDVKTSKMTEVLEFKTRNNPYFFL